MRRLPDEIDAAAHEIECLKAALSCSTNDGESYLGMRGDIEKDRPVLCSLLQLAMQALDRLREKEIEVLKAPPPRYFLSVAPSAIATAGQTVFVS